MEKPAAKNLFNHNAKTTPLILVTLDDSALTRQPRFHDRPLFDVMMDTATEMAVQYQKQGIEVLGCIYRDGQSCFFNPLVADHVALLRDGDGGSDLGVEDRFLAKATQRPMSVLRFTTPPDILSLSDDDPSSEIADPMKNLFAANKRSTFDYVVFENGNIRPQKKAEALVKDVSDGFKGRANMITLNEEILVYGGSLSKRIGERIGDRLPAPVPAKPSGKRAVTGKHRRKLNS